MRDYQTSWTKRLFDILLSTLGLAASAPLCAIIAISLKMEDGGPVFYSQHRVGKGGARFKIWKFRSMTPKSNEPFEIWQSHNDERVTTVGGILRATAMDELPQLWNIFRGDMSFVGPRPLLPAEIDVHCPGEIVPLEKIPGYESRHRVTPGLTGLAQIFASRDLPRRQKFRLDLLYIKRQCFLTDLWFVVLTLWITLRGRCEYPGRKVSRRLVTRPLAAKPAIGLHGGRRTGETLAAGALRGN